MMMSSETKNQVQMISQTILVEAWRVRVLQVSYVLEGEQICVIQFFCNHHSSFKRANSKQTQKIAYIYTYEVFYVLGGKQICVIHFSSAITILRLKEQIQNKHRKSLIFILMSCSAWSETIWAFILFLQFQFSFKSKSKTQKITYIEDISSFVDFSQYVYCHRAQKIFTLYIHTLTYELNGVTMKEDEETRTMNM